MRGLQHVKIHLKMLEHVETSMSLLLNAAKSCQKTHGNLVPKFHSLCAVLPILRMSSVNPKCLPKFTGHY
jgi:hypothetical protein